MAGEEMHSSSEAVPLPRRSNVCASASEPTTLHTVRRCSSLGMPVRYKLAADFFVFFQLVY